MNFKPNKFVRFQDWSSERSSPDVGPSSKKARSSLSQVLESFRSILDRGSERIKSILDRGSERIKSSNKPLSSHSVGDQPSKGLDSRNKILDPQGSYLQTWNKAFLISSVIAVAVDPLFFYIPVIDIKNTCLGLDNPLKIVACLLRLLIDAFYIIHIYYEFRTGFIAPSSRVFGRGELNNDPSAIRKRYLSSYFIIDILAILPLPQVVVLFIVPMVKTRPVSLVTKELLKFVIFCQYVPRLIRIYPIKKQVTRSSGILTETAWAGAAFNLCLYMLASHAFGAFWYMLSIERANRCWLDECKNHHCDDKYLYCDAPQPRTGDYSFLNTSCPFNSTVFNFGIFSDALESGVVRRRNFLEKFFYCFWWGLRNLSALGQNLNTSLYVWEILFAISIGIVGLVIFALFIGNMQKYLQSTTVRIEEMRVKRWDTDQWMSHRMLTDDLKERIRCHEQYKWQETRGVNEEALIRSLPKDLRRDINRHLSWDLVKKVPFFAKMDEQLLDALSDRLKPVLYTKDSIIMREGDPVDEMLFIMRGTIESSTTNGGRTGFFNTVELNAGDFSGEALLTCALDPQSSSNLPISTRTAKAVSEVEAFALKVDDLKFVASQFRRLNSRQLQGIFRYYSVQWKTWASCIIQASWRRYCKRKLAKSLHEAELGTLATEAGTPPSFGAAIYVSKFAVNALRNLRQQGGTRLPQILPSLMPQKPAEPDFSAMDQ